MVNCNSLRKIDIEVKNNDGLDEKTFRGLSNLETANILLNNWFLEEDTSKIIVNIIKPLSNFQTFKIEYDIFRLDSDVMDDCYSERL